MLTTITAGLLIGATTGLLFNVRMVLHLSLLILLVCGSLALFGLIPPTSAALYTLIAVAAVQIGYFVGLVISALGLAREPATVTETAPDSPAGTSFRPIDRSGP